MGLREVGVRMQGGVEGRECGWTAWHCSGALPLPLPLVLPLLLLLLVCHAAVGVVLLPSACHVPLPSTSKPAAAATATHCTLQAAIAVFERQGVEAAAYVRQRLTELGVRPGDKLQW